MRSKSDLAILPAASGAIKTMVDNTLRVTFDFEPRYAADAFRLFGERGTLAAIALVKQETDIELRQTEQKIAETSEKPIPMEQQTTEAASYGDYAAALYKSGFFHAPPVHAALGTDKQYRQWIQQQPSAVSGDYSEWINGEGRSIAAHVRRAGEAGTGFKPTYACIPLTDNEHQIQHRRGESAIDIDWDKARINYLVDWCKSRLYDIFKVDSLTKINPQAFNAWANRNNLAVFVPRMYKDAA